MRIFLRRHAVRFAAFFSAALILATVFINCAVSSAPSSVQTATGQTETVSKLSEANYTIGGSNFRITNYRLSGPEGDVFFQFASACAVRCPVVVVSLPYTGIEWSGDARDSTWAAKDPGRAGLLTPDLDGPGYVPGSGEVISYYNSAPSDAFGFGGIFLKSGVSTVVVYSRFYLGRRLDQYVQDFARVLNRLGELPTVDVTKVAVLGASLGGFIPMHASRVATIKPTVVVGITPLLDVPDEKNFMASVGSRVTANPTQLAFAGNFFRSYLRRMNDFDNSSFSVAKLASEIPTRDVLVIHDSWDTVVPIAQWSSLSALRSIDSFIFQHATPIDYNTFRVDHGQANEGYSNNAVMVMYMSYILNRLKGAGETKEVYYFYNDFVSAMAQVKAAKDRGQNVAWMKTLMTDLCTPNFNLRDISGAMATLTGVQMAGGLLVNVWQAPTTIDQGCAYFAAHPQFF